MKEHDLKNTADSVDQERRQALRRLGLGLSAAYAIPVLMTLSKSAHASPGGSNSGGGGGSNSGGGGGSNSSGGSHSTGGSHSGGSNSTGYESESEASASGVETETESYAAMSSPSDAFPSR